MFRAVIREQNGHFLIEVPQEEIARLDLKDGQQVVLDLSPADADGVPDDELESIVSRLVDEHRAALDYLSQ